MDFIFKKNLIRLSVIAFFVSQSASLSIHAQSPASIKYNWKSVQIVGGGFVDGIVFHPKEKGLVYCRTDMGGAYSRNAKTLRWEPLLDWVPYKDDNLMGVESIALDPNDPNQLFMACGTYTNSGTPNGAILRSSNRGKTFQRTDVPFKFGGNEDGRGNGERMAVDPKDGNILYLGTRHDGLWRSLDKAVSWQKVESFPDITENPPPGMLDRDSISRWKRMNQGCGIDIVLFDTKSISSIKANSIIYVGVSLMNRENLFMSEDAGKSWKALAGQPTGYRPTHAILSSDGILYVSYGNTPGPSNMSNGAVWKYDTQLKSWTEITPDKPIPASREFGYAAVSVDAHSPQTIITSSYHRYSVANGEDIWRSLDAGKSWKQVFGSGARKDSSLAPYTSHTGIHWLFDIEIDPFNPDHAMFTTGYGGHETFNFRDMDRGKPTRWSIMSTGIEETVGLDLLSPSRGAQLISAIGDYGGFVHFDLDKPVPEGSFENPRFNNTSSIATGGNIPDLIVRSGRATNFNPGKNIGFSLDGGKNWQACKSLPQQEASQGHVAVSANGKTWIWSPDAIRVVNSTGRNVQPLPVFYTRDNGSKWSECKGIFGNTRVFADKTDASLFYAMDLFNEKLYISKDSGSNFSERLMKLNNAGPKKRGWRGDSRGGQDCIYTTPGIKGDFWIVAFDGLYHTSDTGINILEFKDVQQCLAFGFGKPAPGSVFPSLYLVGTINEVHGVFRSDDIAKSWIRINDAEHQWGLILQITGDPKLFGRVYIGTHGRGLLYGDPANN